MNLTDLKFIIFLIINIIILFIINKKSSKNRQRVQLTVILIFSISYIFYVDALSALILFIISFILYFGSFCLTNAGAEYKKTIFYCIIIALILSLCLFKYTNSYSIISNVIFSKKPRGDNILLPIGISFYIFTSISYIVDVYCKKIDPRRNYLDLLLMLFYYPKIISGPIVKPSYFFDQIDNYNGIKLIDFQKGIQLFWFGFFKKMVIANRLSLFVDQVFFAPSIFNSKTIVLSVISYSIQIYADFSGYSDMALGISKMLGINLPKNFNFPYLATGCSEFWKRWHISLSTWLKEYIYIPLGGNRINKQRTYFNLITTMIISGIWHGNTLNFLVWGFMYGVWSCFDKYLLKLFSKNKLLNFVYYIITQFIICCLWIIFRSENFDKVAEIFTLIFTNHKGIEFLYIYSFIFMAMIIVVYIWAFYMNKHVSENEYCFYLDLNKFSNLTMFLVFIELTILISYFGDSAFVYGGF